MTASDISSQMIKCARGQKQNTDIKNVRFVHANATRAFSDAPFDKIFAFSLLHLVPDIRATLGAVHNQMKPGGLFISKTVCLGERNLGIRSMVRFLRMLPFTPDVRLISQSALKTQILQSGFEIIETKYFGDQCIDPYIVARRQG
jgi:SAM-dependent methyltransferase